MSFLNRVVNFAKGIFYDNGVSGLTATTVQDAINEVQSNVNSISVPDYTIDIVGNQIKLYKDAVEVGSEDLSLYLDDTNLSRITSGTVDGLGIATFTRDDASTFTIDFSTFFDDTNLPRLVSGSLVGTDLKMVRDDATFFNIDVTALLSPTLPNYTIDIVANQLKFYKDAVEIDSVDLSLYLDDTNLARLTSGSIDGLGIATFTRDDASTFTVDFSSLFDDTNLSRITSGAVVGNDIVFTRDDATTFNVDITDLINDVGELATVKFTSNADFGITTTPSYVPFQTEEIENNPTVLKQNDADNTRYDILETGLYLLLKNVVHDAGGSVQVTSRVIKNGTTTVAGTEFITNPTSAGSAVTPALPVLLTAGDYLQIEAETNTSTANINQNSSFALIKQRGGKGDKGDTGAGANIIVQDEGVTQGTVIDTMDFVGSGVAVTESGGKATVTINGGGGGAPQSYEAEGTSYITYSTGAYNVIPDMTITPPAGTYQVIFSSSGNLSLATSLCLIAIHVDGVIKTSTVRDFFINDVKQQDMDTALLSTGIVTVNGSEAIEVRWNHTGVGVVTMYERTLNLIKVTP